MQDGRTLMSSVRMIHHFDSSRAQSDLAFYLHRDYRECKNILPRLLTASGVESNSQQSYLADETLQWNAMVCKEGTVFEHDPYPRSYLLMLV